MFFAVCIIMHQILDVNGCVDVNRMSIIHQLCTAPGKRRLHITFNRAIDMSSQSLISAVSSLSGIVDRILTSGQSATALEGLAEISAAHNQFPQVSIIAAGGINGDNVSRFACLNGVHLASAVTVNQQSPAISKSRAFMGSLSKDSEHLRKVVSCAKTVEINELFIKSRNN